MKKVIKYISCILALILVTVVFIILINSKISLVTNEDLKIEKIDLKGEEHKFYIYDNSALSFVLPEGFSFDYNLTEDENLSLDKNFFSIKIYRVNQKDAFVTLKVQDDAFGVCGTGLEINQLSTIYGTDFNVGYYDGNELFSYISMEIDNKTAVIINETNNLKKEDCDLMIEMAKTINLVKGNNDMGQTFLYSQKYDDSTFELDESCKDYFKIEVEKNLIDRTSRVKVIPLKETKKMSLIIYETHKEDNVPKAVNVYEYDTINKYNSDNQLVIYFENDEKEIF